MSYLNRYIKLTLIPAFFALIILISSCSNSDKKIENFITFDEVNGESFTENSSTKKSEKTQNFEKKEKVDKRPNKKSDINILKEYNLDYLTFDVADFFAEIKPIKETPDYIRYRIKFYSHTNGIVDHFFNWMSYSVAYVKDYGNKIVPEKFQTKVRLRKKVKEMQLSFDSKGDVKFEKVTPPDNRVKRPAVDDKLKKRVLDPLSMIIATRNRLKDAIANDYFNEKGFYSFSLPLYDARRRTEILFRLEEKKIDGLYKLVIKRKPIAGYTKNELEKTKNGGITITVFVDPKTILPVKAEATHPLGTAYSKFEKDCNLSFENCIKRDD